MKKLLSMVMVLGLVLVAGIAFADTNTLTVQASVIGICKLSSGTSTLDFGALDPSLTSDGAATTTVNFWCTKSAGYTVAANNGAHFGSCSKRMLGPTAGDLIPYSLSNNPSTGTGSGKTTPIVLTLTGSILNADYVNAAVGSYSDTGHSNTNHHPVMEYVRHKWVSGRGGEFSHLSLIEGFDCRS